MITFSGFPDLLQKMGGIHTALTLTVAILLSHYTMNLYEKRIAKQVKTEFIDVFATTAESEIHEQIKTTLTP